MVRLASALALAALALAPAVGRAATPPVLNTSPLLANAGESYHECTVVNVSTVPVNVTIELLGANGQAIAGPTTVPKLAAGAITDLVPGSATYTGLARCRFTFVPATAVTTPSPPIRANLMVIHSSSGVVQTYAVSEAQ
jgi:hypothetical protein